MMTAGQSRKLVERAKRFARSRGHAQDADDFAQEAWIALARGRKASLEQLLSDYLRQEYGCTGARSGSGKSSKGAIRRATSLDAPLGDEDARSLHDSLASPGADPGSLGLDWRHGANLGAREERILELVGEGWDQGDIADIFGFTASRVCQIVGVARSKLERAGVMNEAYDLYRLDPEASVLVVEWITL